MTDGPFDCDRDQILRDLALPAAWEQLDGAGLDRLALGALGLIGHGDGDAEQRFAAFYGVYVRRSLVRERQRVFAQVAAAARANMLRPNVLTPFLRVEVDRHIVCEAAFELACRIAVGPEYVRGANQVLDLVVCGAVRNAGASLGGLLAQGDAEVLAKLALLRPALALPGSGGTLAQMARCARACVHAGTIEFWVEWMEAMSAGLPGSQRVLDRAAEALLGLREAMTEPVVHDGRCILPAEREGLVHGWEVRALPLGEFAAWVSPRLAAVAAAAPGSAAVQRALAAWSLRH